MCRSGLEMGRALADRCSIWRALADRQRWVEHRRWVEMGGALERSLRALEMGSIERLEIGG
jgi:hypothetical protein